MRKANSLLRFHGYENNGGGYHLVNQLILIVKDKIFLFLTIFKHYVY